LGLTLDHENDWIRILSNDYIHNLSLGYV